MNCVIKFLSVCVLVSVVATASADTWDEMLNGGGDAGNFPAGSFQTTTDSTVFDVITGNMDPVADPDRDCFLITVTDPATFSVVSEDPQTGNAEDDTRFWLWDMSGNLVMANDDDPLTPTAGFPFFAALTDPSTWPGDLVDAPGSVTAGETYILTIGGFSTDPEDSANVDLADIGTNFSSLSGLNPLSSGVFAAWEAFTTLGGDYQIRLTGCEFGTSDGGGGGGPCKSPLGDLNGDGVVSLLDVQPFVAAILDGTFQCEADLNQDNTVDLLDIAPFVDMILGG